MKYILSFFMLCLFTLPSQAQDHHLYWKYKDYDGAIPVKAPRWLITAGSWFAPEKKDRKLIRKVHKARVLVFEDGNPIKTRDMDRFERKAKRRRLEDMVFVRDGDTKVRVMAKDRRAAIRKVVVFVSSPEEFVLVSLKGKLHLDDLVKAINQISNDDDAGFDVPGLKKHKSEKL
ncbi:MAG: DUF4252 domain-containing protein [Saprospiraceae bacterium]|jgi:hypothetical protein